MCISTSCCGVTCVQLMPVRTPQDSRTAVTQEEHTIFALCSDLKRQEILVDVHLDELLRCNLRPVEAGQNATRFENGGDPGGAHHFCFMLSLGYARAQYGHIAEKELEQIRDVVANVIFGRPNDGVKLFPIDLGTGRVIQPQSGNRGPRVIPGDSRAEGVGLYAVPASLDR